MTFKYDPHLPLFGDSFDLHLAALPDVDEIVFESSTIEFNITETSVDIPLGFKISEDTTVSINLMSSVQQIKNKKYVAIKNNGFTQKDVLHFLSSALAHHFGKNYGAKLISMSVGCFGRVNIEYY